MMPPFIYRCPNTGFRVQGLAPKDDDSEGADNTFNCLIKFRNPARIRVQRSEA
jgi:hypothetical protein